jgi:hypothetical protein
MKDEMENKTTAKSVDSGQWSINVQHELIRLVYPLSWSSLPAGRNVLDFDNHLFGRIWPESAIRKAPSYQGLIWKGDAS